MHASSQDQPSQTHPYFLRPEPLQGPAHFMAQMFCGDDLSATAAGLIQRTERNPLDADALLELANILLLRGDRATGLALQTEALQIKRFYPWRQASSINPIRLLVLKAPGDFMANTPVEFLLENPQFSIDVLYVATHLPIPLAAPTHDAIFVAVSEAEHTRDTLALIETLVKRWGNPVINPPARIPGLCRDQVCHSLARLKGLAMPVNIRRSRHALVETPALAYPFIIRPLDSHAGMGLAKIDNPTALTEYLQTQVADHFYLAPYIDYRSADGQFRKYRIVFIQGQPFLCHMAISSHWMVHYLNAGMTESPEKRQEEASAMANFETQFSQRHGQAFSNLVDAIGLDYFGIDCAETRDGELLIFEVANAMVVHAMDPADTFPYKAEAMSAVFSAFQAMIIDHARQPLAAIA